MNLVVSTSIAASIAGGVCYALSRPRVPSWVRAARGSLAFACGFAAAMLSCFDQRFFPPERHWQWLILLVPLSAAWDLWRGWSARDWVTAEPDLSNGPAVTGPEVWQPSVSRATWPGDLLAAGTAFLVVPTWADMVPSERWQLLGLFLLAGWILRAGPGLLPRELDLAPALVAVLTAFSAVGFLTALQVSLSYALLSLLAIAATLGMALAEVAARSGLARGARAKLRPAYLSPLLLTNVITAYVAFAEPQPAFWAVLLVPVALLLLCGWRSLGGTAEGDRPSWRLPIIFAVLCTLIVAWVAVGAAMSHSPDGGAGW